MFTSPGTGSERFAVKAGNRVARRCMILAAAGSDLDRAHDRGKLAGGLPVHALCDSVEQPGPVRVAATSGIDHRLGLDAPDFELSAVIVNHRAFRALRDDQRL